MKRIKAVMLWIVLNLLPDGLSIWLLDLFLPNWVDAARKAMRRKGS